jgi:peptidyl-prolyl cis-trans isomerase SurA
MMSRRTAVSAAVFALALLPALPALAQPYAASPATPPAPDDSSNPNLRFANGIAAIVEGKVITVDDIRREIQPLIPQLQQSSKSEKEFNDKLEQLQDDTIQNLIDRELVVKDFLKDEKRRIPEHYIDGEISRKQAEEFDNDRSKFLAYLRSRGLTLREYRKEVGEDIMYSYMRGQQRKSSSIVSPVKIEQYYNENKDRFYQEDIVHLRMIQLSRAPGETDDAVKARLDEIVEKFKGGAKFEDLAKQYSQEASRRNKGGDWGPQKRSDLKKEFSEPLFAMKKGEISAPLVLPEGGFLLYVEDRSYAGIEPIDKVREQIERILIQQMASQGQERWLERLRRNGYVKHY